MHTSADRHTTTDEPWIALFDLDGTLTWRDTLLPYLAGFLRRHPLRLLRLWRLPACLLRYAVHRDRGELKSAFIRMAMGGADRTQVGAWSQDFVARMKSAGRLRPAALAIVNAHRAAGDHLVLLSASPDLYVPRIGELLGFERTVCTEVSWDGERLDGRLATPNRRGVEKSRCLDRLRAQYAGCPVIAYGNSASDLDHMHRADRALLVNGNAGARRLAARLSIHIADWKGC